MLVEPQIETSCFSQLTDFISSRTISVLVCEINIRCFLNSDSIPYYYKYRFYITTVIP